DKNRVRPHETEKHEARDNKQRDATRGPIHSPPIDQWPCKQFKDGLVVGAPPNHISRGGKHHALPRRRDSGRARAAGRRADGATPALLLSGNYRGEPARWRPALQPNFAAATRLF